MCSKRTEPPNPAAASDSPGATAKPEAVGPAHYKVGDHAEIFMVLEGSCVFDGQPMKAKDMTIVAANQAYGFVSGPDGLQFLIVRNGEANFASVE